MFPAAPDSVIHTIHALDLAQMMADVGEAVAYVDANWVARYCNDVYLENLGLRRSEVIGRTPFEYAPNFARSIFYDVCRNALESGTPKTRIGFSKVLNRWLMIRVFPLRGGLVLFANDASESVVNQYQLAQKVVKDPLTDLGNKLALGQAIDQLMKSGQPFSLLLVGVDRLKDVNDAHGYGAGDRVLQEVASSLQTSTVDGETLFRVSGNEFAVVHTGEAGLSVAERGAAFIHAVRTPVRLAGANIVLQAHCGTVEVLRDGGDFETLLKHAALALRDARRSGAQEPTAYRAEFEIASQERAMLEDEFRTALDAEQFTLLIQPKVSLSTGGVIGGEALIRWVHPTRGILAPAAFLGIAQDIKAMARIDQWVLRQALKICADLADRDLHTPISINLSVDSLADIQLAERVRDALADAGVDPGMLEIEIPEGALMHDVGLSSRILAQLSAMGVRISVDDFGTGYSSFAYLARFPVHTLKIDRSLIMDIATDGSSKSIVRAIVQLAHTLSLDVVAEGVEDQQGVDILRSMQCDSVQGYVYAKPLPLCDYRQFAARNPGLKRASPLAI